MKFTYDWLKACLKTRLPAAQLAERLTDIGFEVDSLDDQARALHGFQVGEIMHIAPHPNADRLRLCTVRHKKGTQQVVCGAPNARVGLKSVFAPVGTVIPSTREPLGAAVIRGVESAGMLCSQAELQLGKDADGIIELPASAKAGQAAAQALGLTDIVFDVTVLPNRGDCMGVMGLARELAAAGAGQLRPQPLGMAAFETFARAKTHIQATRKIVIDKAAMGHCAIFAACELHGATPVPSPQWLAGRLRAIGMTPVSVPVDITNYAALTFGHPMHVYDMAKVTGDVRVRLATDGETLTGIDGRTYTLKATDCVIADARNALGVGGVMGGAPSACQSTSSDLLLEAAWFAPTAIARTGQRLNCASESRQRYERGVDRARTLPVLAWAAQQIQTLCGGVLARPVVAGARRVPVPKAKPFHPDALARVAGTKVDLPKAKRTLVALGFAVSVKNRQWQVRPPSWRYDMGDDVPTRTAAIVEEVLRFGGVAQIPATPLPPTNAVPAPSLPPVMARISQTRRLLAARGLSEVVSWSFLSKAQLAQYGGKDQPRLANPISEDLAYMRHSLVPQLGAAAQRNLARRADWVAPVHLFELGQVFAPDNSQANMMAVLRTAPATRDWQGTPADMRFAAKADALAVLDTFGLEPDAIRYEAKTLPPYYHPAQSAGIWLGRKCLGYVGALHPSCATALDMQAPCGIAELYLDAVAPAPKRTARPISDLPFVRRDFAFVCGTAISAAAIEQAARQADTTHIIQARIFDVFRLPDAADKKSLALEVVLRPDKRTFTDAEIADISARIVETVQRATGARLRQ